MNLRPIPLLASLFFTISGCAPPKLLTGKCSLQEAETIVATLSASVSEGKDSLITQCGRAYLSFGTAQHTRILKIPNEEDIIVKPVLTSSTLN